MKIVLPILFLLLSGKHLLAQTIDINNEALTIQQAFELIESKSDYIFNYDPELIENYYSSEPIVDISNIDYVLNKVLYKSPFSYEKDGPTILIYYPDPQSYRICGTLKDALSQEPLLGAHISLLGTSIGTQSDHLGYFEFEYTGDKHQLVEISYLGYQSIQFSLQELNNEDCPLRNLKVDEYLFGDKIVIKDYLLDGITLEDNYMGFVMDLKRLSHGHSIAEHDIFKTAQLLPGITSIDDSATNIQIRGSDPGQNLVLWEGAPLYNAGHVFGMISAINPFSIDKVSIYKGAYNPKFDNRVGGILDISLSDELASKFNGSVGTTMTEVHSNLSIPLIKNQLTFELSGRQSINTLFNSPTLNSYTDKVFQFTIIDDQKMFDETLRTEQSLQFSDWNLKLVYRPAERIRLKTGFYGNAQDFNYSFWLNDNNFLSQDNIKIGTQVATLAAEYTVTKQWTSILSAYQSSYVNGYSKSETENEILISSNDQLNSNNERSISLSNDFNLNKHWFVNMGYEYNHKAVLLDLGNDINFDPEFLYNKFEDAHFHNIFQSFRFTNNQLQVDGGNRSSYYLADNAWFHSPRINVKFAINHNFTIKSDAGIYHQFISQLTNIGANQIKVDNPLWMLNTTQESLAQRATKIATGIVFQKGQWLIDVDGYYNRINGINTVSPQLGSLINLNGFSQGTARVYGIDALLKKRWSTAINTWFSYSLGFASFTFPDFQNSKLPASNDIRHNLSFVGSYKYKKFKFSTNTNYRSGLPFSEPNLVKNLEDPEAEPGFEYFLDYNRFNSERLDYYLRIDVNASYRFGLKRMKGSHLELSCSVLNVLDRTNIVARESWLDYNETTKEYKSSFIQKALLGRTPLILLRYYW